MVNSCDWASPIHTWIDLIVLDITESGPFVGEDGRIHGSDPQDFRADGHRRVHQPAVIVVEIVLQADTVGVDEFDRLETLLVRLRIDGEREPAGLDFQLVEHPLVEEQVFIAGGRHHERDGSPLGTGYRFSRIVDRLVEFVGTLHDSILPTANLHTSLQGHGKQGMGTAG